MKKTGKIEAVSQKEKGYSFKIGENWFSGFGKAPAKKGDEVEFEFFENNGFNNISKKGVKVIKANTDTLDKDQFRMNVDVGNCLQRAVELVIAGKMDHLKGGKVSQIEAATLECIAAFKLGLLEMQKKQEIVNKAPETEEESEYEEQEEY